MREGKTIAERMRELGFTRHDDEGVHDLLDAHTRMRRALIKLYNAAPSGSSMYLLACAPSGTLSDLEKLQPTFDRLDEALKEAATLLAALLGDKA